MEDTEICVCEPQQVIAAGLHAYVEAYVTEPERLLANNDQRGFYKDLESTVGLEGDKARSEQFISDEYGTLLRDEVRVRRGWGWFNHRLLNTKSLIIDSTIAVCGTKSLNILSYVVIFDAWRYEDVFKTRLGITDSHAEIPPGKRRYIGLKTHLYGSSILHLPPSTNAFPDGVSMSKSSKKR